MTKQKSHFVRSTIIIAVCSLLSRILGLLRVSLLGSFFGATRSEGLTDCYAAAFKLPDIIFNLVAFGAISIVLIPYFSGFIKKEQLDELKKTCSQFLNFFLLIICLFIIVGFLIAPFFVKNFLVRGWADSLANKKNIELTVLMTRILLLQVLFMTLSGIFGSYLNAIEKFTAYAFALLSYNIGIIFGILVLAPFMSIIGVAWGAVLGSFIHFMIQASGSMYNGFKYSFGMPKMNKDIKELIFIAFPRIIAIGGEQFVKFFIVNIASFLFIGSIFIFENAENFSMVPFGMLAVSISTTAFPVFAKLYVSKEYNLMLKNLIDKLRAMMFFIIPITIIMIIFKYQIIEILLAYKKYSQHDVLLTSDALGFYMIGIPFFSITIVVVKFYYAQKKSFLPMIVTLIMVAVTILCCYIFSKDLNVTGLSIGRSIGYIIQALLLILFLFIYNKKEKLFTEIPVNSIVDIFKIMLISAVFIIPAFISKFNIMFFQNQKLNSLLIIVVFGGISSIFYFIFCFIFKVPEAGEIVKRIKLLFKKS